MMGVLNRQQLKRRLLDETDLERRLIVTPLLDLNEQVGGNSLDVRLGSYFVTHRRANVANIDPQDETLGQRGLEIEEHTHVPLGGFFVLHPRQFAMGGTLEYLGLPCDLTAQVIGKSSWGRLGLVIATAAGVHAWYRGIITLELANVGEIPLLLYPGRPIAQLFFHEAEPLPLDQADDTAYLGATRPEASKLAPDPRIRMLQDRRRPPT